MGEISSHRASQLLMTPFVIGQMPVLVGAFLLFVGTLQLSAEPVECSNPMVFVETSEPDLAERVCTEAVAAVERLAACHIPQRFAINLQVVDRIVHAEEMCLGLFIPGEKILKITSPNQFSAGIGPDNILSQIPTLELFDSLIVHELTHALVDQQPYHGKQCLENQEYIAYAMQLEAMSSASRKILIDAAGGEIEVTGERLNAFVALAAPVKFAAWSWMHFTAPQNGCDFVGKLVSGETTLKFP